VHWIEFREVYDRINKATGKAEKFLKGIVKYLNAKHQLVYGNDEYVDRFIIGDAAYARINEDVKMTDESVLVLLNSSAIYGDDWPFEDYDNNLLEIQDKAIAHNFGGGGVYNGNLNDFRFYGRHSWRCYAIMGIASLSSLDDVGKK